MNSILTAMALSLLGGLVLWLMAFGQWLGPWTPLLLGLVVVTPLAVGVTVLMYEELRDGWPPEPIHGQVALGALAVAGVTTVFWALPQVRAGAVEWVREGSLREALRDPSSRVAVRACERFVEDQERTSFEISSVLTRRPTLARACLGAHASIARTARVEAVTRQIGDRWHEMLQRASGPEAPKLCVLAEGLAPMSVQRGWASSAALDCALRAEDARIQSCCAEQLEGFASGCHELADRVDGERLERWGSIPELVVESFGIRAAGLDTRHQTDLGLTCAPMKRLALQGLCYRLTQQDYTRQEQRLLEVLADRDLSCMSREEASELVSGPELCQLLLEELDQGRVGLEEPDALCRTRQRLARGQLARRQEREQRDAGIGGDLIASIHRAHAVAGGAGSDSSLEAMAERMLRGEEDCYTNTQRVQMLRQMWGEIPSGLGVNQIKDDALEVEDLLGEKLANPKVQGRLKRRAEDSDDQEDDVLAKFEEIDEQRAESREQFEQLLERTEEERGEDLERAERELECLRTGGDGCELEARYTKREPLGVPHSPCMPGMGPQRDGVDGMLDGYRQDVERASQGSWRHNALMLR